MRLAVVVRERLCVELGAVRLRWDDWCACRGLTAGEGVRQLIMGALRDDGDTQFHAVTPEPLKSTVGELRTRIEIRLTAVELVAVEQRSTAAGLSANRWIVSLVRAHLTHEPQFGERELRVLSASSQQLAGISRLLGLCARSGGASLDGQSWPEDWAEMRNQIDAHLRANAAVIRANLDRWSR